MTIATKHTILKSAKQLFATKGYEGFSIRTLASKSGVGLSSIYHFFEDKDEILKEIYTQTNRDLGLGRSKLPLADSAGEVLLDRIRFQFQHIEDIVFVLKYYIHFRPTFLKLESGYFPAKGYLHIEEILHIGVENGEFTIGAEDIPKQSKVITHAINGYLLEYYPDRPKKDELDEVVHSIHEFLMRSLTYKEVLM